MLLPKQTDLYSKFKSDSAESEHLEMNLFNKLICLNMNIVGLPDYIFNSKWNSQTERPILQKMMGDLTKLDNDGSNISKLSQCEVSEQCSPGTTSPSSACSVSISSNSITNEAPKFPVLYIPEPQSNLALSRMQDDIKMQQVSDRKLMLHMLESKFEMKKSQEKTEDLLFKLEMLEKQQANIVQEEMMLNC